jgi:putative oxidoreductase
MSFTGPALGLLVVRLIGGGIFAGHGAQKAFGWWKGPGPAGWRKAIEGMNIRPVGFWWFVSIAAELVGGLALVVGILSPLVAAVLIGQLVVIIFRAHWSKGFWNRDGGIEFPLALAMAPLMVVAAGAGGISVDAAVGFALPGAWRLGLAIVGALVGAAVILTLRLAPRPSPAAAAR